MLCLPRADSTVAPAPSLRRSRAACVSSAPASPLPVLSTAQARAGIRALHRVDVRALPACRARARAPARIHDRLPSPRCARSGLRACASVAATMPSPPGSSSNDLRHIPVFVRSPPGPLITVFRADHAGAARRRRCPFAHLGGPSLIAGTSPTIPTSPQRCGPSSRRLIPISRAEIENRCSAFPRGHFWSSDPVSCSFCSQGSDRCS